MSTAPPFALNVNQTLRKYDIFLTGSSGFVGIAMLEKLLFLHNKVNNGNIRNMNKIIYLLLRPSRKYTTIESRLKDEMLTNSIFNDYNRNDLLYLIENKKIIPIKGDLTMNLLSISNDNILLMQHNAKANDLLFCHGAADINFNPPFNHSMKMNVYGTYQCIKLAQLLNAKGFLHLSTLYVNVREKSDAFITEKIYNQGFNGVDIFEKWLKNNKHLDDKYVYNNIKSKIDTNNKTQRKEWPNHYTLTKNIGEQCVAHYCKSYNIRYTIARLAVIGPYTKKDNNKQGWYYAGGQGYVTFSVGSALGYIRYLNCDGTANTDVVPIDYTVNAMCSILCTFDDKYYFKQNFYHNIYQLGILANFPDTTMDESFEYIHNTWDYGKKRSKIKYIQNKYLFDLVHFIRYDIPLYLVTPIIYLNNIIYGNQNKIDRNKLNKIQKLEFELNKLNPPKLTKISKQIEFGKNAREKLRQFHENYIFFFNQKFIFDNKNVNQLWDYTDIESKKDYYFDTRDIILNEYRLNTAMKAANDYEKYLKKSINDKTKRKQEIIQELNRLKNRVKQTDNNKLMSKL